MKEKIASIQNTNAIGTSMQSSSHNYYYAVIFTSQLSVSDQSSCQNKSVSSPITYGEMADRMILLASQQNGFIGVESARNTNDHVNNQDQDYENDHNDAGVGITVSYWTSLEAIKKWKANIDHLEAQRIGKDKWYQWYKLRICRVEREYVFTRSVATSTKDNHEGLERKPSNVERYENLVENIKNPKHFSFFVFLMIIFGSQCCESVSAFSIHLSHGKKESLQPHALYTISKKKNNHDSSIHQDMTKEFYFNEECDSAKSQSRRQTIFQIANFAAVVPFSSMFGIIPNKVLAATTSSILDPSSPTEEDVKDSSSTEVVDFTARPIYRLQSGIQCRDERVGKGPFVNQGLAEGLDDDDEEEEGTSQVVALHVQALLRDGSILIDTRQDGRPILYKLGSALQTINGNAAASASSSIAITPGIDDALVGRGAPRIQDVASSSGRKSSSMNLGRLPPMRQGGIRLVVVPPDLAYGDAGLSRYQIFRNGQGIFKQAVPRNEVIRYEVEVLRCLNVPTERIQSNNNFDVNSGESEITKTEQTKQVVCCPEEKYPCI